MANVSRSALSGRRALITGSSQGIGFAIARALLEDGAAVVVNGRDRARLDRAARELAPLGEVRAVAGDVADRDQLAELVREVQAGGPVDVLVSNVPLNAPTAFLAASDDDWQRSFEVNFMPSVRLARAVLPGMIERDFGRVVFMSSTSAISVDTRSLPYSTMKIALLALSRGLAQECARTGVTVNAVLPGPTWTPGIEHFVELEAASRGRTVDQVIPELFAELRPTSLRGQFIGADEVAELVRMICNPLMRSLTGAAYRIDGGEISTCV